MNNENNNFYENLDLRFTEVAILMEDIELPKLPTVEELSKLISNAIAQSTAEVRKKVNLPEFRVEKLYTDVIGKFCIPVLFPLESSPKDTPMPSPTVRNIQSDCNLRVSSYEKSNYVEINIPKYILLNFLDKIPAGTRFLIIFVGGSIEIADIRIIGVKDYGQIN